ncbi:MAG: endonuclease/exonuclease/phosphatase family protein [Parvibaculaceae bacterium]
MSRIIDRRAFAFLSLALPFIAAGTAMAETQLTIMSFNIWGAGANAGKPVDETVAAIRAAKADIIGIQETRAEPADCSAEVCPATGESRARAIADALGFHVYEQTAQNEALWSNAILSRYPIGKATANDLGVPITVDGRTVYAFNIHLDDAPYQPYQLTGIEYGPYPFLKTEAEAVAAAEATRGPGLKLLFEDLPAADNADAAFIFGDFNEPSFRDWTAEAAKAGNHPIAVAFPTTKAIEAHGFLDTFRTIFPDPVAKTAFTWTPTSDPKSKEDHHDRIDFAFARGGTLKIISAGIVGEKAPEADIVSVPWPSDHRATMAVISF